MTNARLVWDLDPGSTTSALRGARGVGAGQLIVTLPLWDLVQITSTVLANFGPYFIRRGL